MKKMLKAGTHAVSVEGVEFIADDKGMIDVDGQPPEVLAGINQLAEVRDLTADELASLEATPAAVEEVVVKRGRKKAAVAEDTAEAAPAEAAAENPTEADPAQA